MKTKEQEDYVPKDVTKVAIKLKKNVSRGLRGKSGELTVESLTPVQETESMPRCGPTAVYSGRGIIGAAETTVSRTGRKLAKH